MSMLFYGLFHKSTELGEEKESFHSYKHSVADAPSLLKGSSSFGESNGVEISVISDSKNAN